MLDYRKFRTESQFKPSTVCSRAEFNELAKAFESGYLELMGCKLSDTYENLKEKLV